MRLRDNIYNVRILCGGKISKYKMNKIYYMVLGGVVINYDSPLRTSIYNSLEHDWNV